MITEFLPNAYRTTTTMNFKLFYCSPESSKRVTCTFAVPSKLAQEHAGTENQQCRAGRPDLCRRLMLSLQFAAVRCFGAFVFLMIASAAHGQLPDAATVDPSGLVRFQDLAQAEARRQSLVTFIWHLVEGNSVGIANRHNQHRPEYLRFRWCTQHNRPKSCRLSRPTGYRSHRRI